MSETTETPNPNTRVQHFINTWGRRPRHDLDFSMLSEESRQDVLWIAELLQSLIPSARIIQEKFDLTPQDVIVIDLPPPASATGPTAHPDSKNGSEHVSDNKTPLTGSRSEIYDNQRTDPETTATIQEQQEAALAQVDADAQKAIRQAQLQEQDSNAPSTAQEPKPALEPNSGSPKPRRKKGRKRKARGQKQGKSDKFSSALAKAGVTLSVPAPETLPAATPPAPVSTKPGVDLSDPPAPTLGPTGES